MKKKHTPELVAELVFFLAGFVTISYKANVWVAIGVYLIGISCILASDRIKRQHDKRINSAGVQQEQETP